MSASELLTKNSISGIDIELQISTGSFPSGVREDERNPAKEPMFLPESPAMAKRKSITNPTATSIMSVIPSRDTNILPGLEMIDDTPKKETKVEAMMRIFKFSKSKTRSNESLPGSAAESGANTPPDTSLQSITESINEERTSPTGGDFKSNGPKKAPSLLRKLSSAILQGRRKSKLSQVSSAAPELNVDSIIAKLKSNTTDGLKNKCPVDANEISLICREARELTLLQPILLELQAPIFICGDIHGQFNDLLTLFELCGDPAKANYLFLGDYVDRGKQSLETILLLMCYKIKYPETFFLLRGNHECASINRGIFFQNEKYFEI
jgi:hypothetical protein